MPTPFTKSSAKKMNGSPKPWVSRLLKIQNEAGLHTRPAAALVKIAQQYPAQIRICKGKRCVSAKSILSLLTLGAKKGEKIIIKAKGIRSDEALKKLGALVASKFHE